MNRINFKQLDIPIIRSCNLACEGCITHSNHKKIKGLVSVEEGRSWLEYWAQYLDPNSINIFGGEPLLHPEFIEWPLYLRKVWGPRPSIKVNTNGYYLQKLLDNVEILFNSEITLSVIISVQTPIEPYRTTVLTLAEKLKNAIFDFRAKQPDVNQIQWNTWQNDSDKRWDHLEINGISTGLSFVVTEMYNATWCKHYEGFGESMTPVYSYDDPYYDENHKWCQAKEFVTLYKGDLYKCPPIGVLEHTLTTFDIQHTDIWNPYLNKYQKLRHGATAEEITNWFEIQKRPEQVCNMCGFSGPKGQFQPEFRSHLSKGNWKYPIRNS